MGKFLDVAFISDLHLGHDAIAAIRGFQNIDEYNEEVIRRWNSVCGKKTLVFNLGDATMENRKYYPLLSRLNGRIALVGGNHELRKDYIELSKYVESISGAIKYKGLILTHIPIHPQEVNRFILNVHGHSHTESMQKLVYKPMVGKVSEHNDPRYKNVSWDMLDGIPIGFKEIMDSIKTTT